MCLETAFNFEFADISQQQNKTLESLVLQKTQNKQQKPFKANTQDWIHF